MLEKETGSVLHLAQELVDHLPEEMKDVNDELRRLVLRAKDGPDPMIEIEIDDLFSQYPVTRRLMKGTGDAESEKESLTTRDTFSGSSKGAGMGLAGNPSFIPPSRKWVCPKDKHEPWVLVMQEGEDPPTCKVHEIKMVRGSKSKG